MIRSTYLHDFESDPILHRVHAVIPLGFLHSTFCATEKAIMENSKDNWARNCSLWSPAHLTSLVWQASPLSECSLSVITSSLYLFACSWGSLGQSPKVCLHLLLPPLQHLTPEKGSIQPDLFLIKSRHHFLLFSVPLQCSKITRGWLCHQFKVPPPSILWQQMLFALYSFRHPFHLKCSQELHCPFLKFPTVNLIRLHWHNQNNL